MIKYENIQLVLENCEVLTIPQNTINYFMVSDVTHNVYSYDTGEVRNYLGSKMFLLYVKNEFLDKPYTEGFVQTGQTNRERLLGNDVVEVCIDYGEDTDVYTIEWGDYDNVGHGMSSLQHLIQFKDFSIVCSLPYSVDEFLERYKFGKSRVVTVDGRTFTEG